MKFTHDSLLFCGKFKFSVTFPIHAIILQTVCSKYRERLDPIKRLYAMIKNNAMGKKL